MLALYPSAESCARCKKADIRVFSDSVLCLGRDTVFNASNKFTERWLNHFADRGVNLRPHWEVSCLAEPQRGVEESLSDLQEHIARLLQQPTDFSLHVETVKSLQEERRARQQKFLACGDAHPG